MAPEKLLQIKKIFDKASEYHNESDDWEDIEPIPIEEQTAMYTVIFHTEHEADNYIHKLRKLGCECHCEDEYDVPGEEQRTMWTVLWTYKTIYGGQ